MEGLELLSLNMKILILAILTLVASSLSAAYPEDEQALCAALAIPYAGKCDDIKNNDWRLICRVMAGTGSVLSCNKVLNKDKKEFCKVMNAPFRVGQCNAIKGVEDRNLCKSLMYGSVDSCNTLQDPHIRQMCIGINSGLWSKCNLK